VQEQRFLGAAAEQERVTPFQPGHQQALARLVGHKHRNGVLGHRAFGGRTHLDPFGVGSCQAHDRRHGAVVHHDIGVGQYLSSPRGQQAGVAGACADENDSSSCGVLIGVHFANSRRGVLGGTGAK